MIHARGGMVGRRVGGRGQRGVRARNCYAAGDIATVR
jgi:hypothetical protein